MHAVINSPYGNFMYVDVNQDGNKDLAYLESGPQFPLPYGIAVLLANGTGRFGQPVRSPILDVGVNQSIMDFTLADFRGSGLPDLLLLVWQGTQAHPNATGYLVYAKNNGDGTFQKPTLTPFGSVSPFRFAVGDFNSDGRPDAVFYFLCYLDEACQTQALIPYLGNGDGTFQQGTAIAFNTGTFPFVPGIRAADVNADGKVDLLMSGYAVVSASDQNALYLLTGNGDGTFLAPKLLFSNPGSTSYFDTDDLNKDGIPDLVEEAVHNGVIANSIPRIIRTYAGQPDGSFHLTGTFGPFPNQYAYALLFGDPDKPAWPFRPSLGDFNGDGNLDIAVFEVDPGGTYAGGVFTGAGLPIDLLILAGNGDATFTLSRVGFGLGSLLAPQLVGDVNGDHRADLVEMDGYSSSYNIVTAQPGASFSLGLVSSPVVGTSGKLQIALAFPATSDTVVQLSASDPAISIPPTVTFPAGTVSQEVPFQIGASFNPNHVFALTGQLGSEIHEAYGTKAAQVSGTGFIVETLSPPPSPPAVVPSQSVKYDLIIASLGGYSTEIEVSCLGLPSGASCQLPSNPMPLPPGQILIAEMTISTGLSTPLGSYNPTAVFTDGSVTRQLSAPFNVGDFSLSISPPTQTIPPTGWVRYEYTLTGTNGFLGPVEVSTSGLPTGATGGLFGTLFCQGVSLPFNVWTENAAEGTYDFTATATAASLVRAASATLVVQATAPPPPPPPDFTGSVFPSSATLRVGESADFQITLNSQNGATGSVSFQCLDVPVGITCAFAPTSVTLPANGVVSDTLTVKVNSRPALDLPENYRRWPFARVGLRKFSVLAALLGLNIATLIAMRRRPRSVALSTSFLIGASLIFLAAASCGGGGSSVGPPPPPASKTHTFTILATGAGISTPKNLGTITITVK